MIKDKLCPVCKEKNWKPFLKIDTGRIMTGDQRIISGRLEKKICATCNTTTNANAFTMEELKGLYGSEYILNTLGKEEHRFFIGSKSIPRSKVFFDWITPWLPTEFKSLLEIGCGEGNLLKRFVKGFKKKKVMGIDGSEKACVLAKNKGLDVSCGMILSDKDSIPEVDVILSINVLEHVEDLGGFISVLKKSLNENGRIIFCVPVQNFPGYDIFFAEHVWHLTTSHLHILLEQNGLKCIHIDDSNALNPGIGLFVCEKKESPSFMEIVSEPCFVEQNREQWLKIFETINLWVKSSDVCKIAVFGSGEVATLFYAFTGIGDIDVATFIDEDPAKIGTNKHGIQICGIEWLKPGKVDMVLAAVNPRYHEIVKKKIRSKGIELKMWGNIE